MRGFRSRSCPRAPRLVRRPVRPSRSSVPRFSGADGRRCLPGCVLAVPVCVRCVHSGVSDLPGLLREALYRGRHPRVRVLRAPSVLVVRSLRVAQVPPSNARRPAATPWSSRRSRFPVPFPSCVPPPRCGRSVRSGSVWSCWAGFHTLALPWLVSGSWLPVLGAGWSGRPWSWGGSRGPASRRVLPAAPSPGFFLRGSGPRRRPGCSPTGCALFALFSVLPVRP